MLTAIEKKLLEIGFDAMTTSEKNQLISLLANSAGKMYYEITPEEVLNHHKYLKIEQLSDITKETIATGFTSTNGHLYRTNGDDRENMIGKAVQLILKPEITSVMWKTEDVGYIDHTRTDWIDKVFIEGLAFKENTLFKYNTLKGQVTNATTDAEVLAIVW